MGKIISQTEGVITLVTVDGEEDLKRKPGVYYIYGPPIDGRCECCGKHISELQPSDVDGYFKGAYLIKHFRKDGPYNEEAEKAVAEARKNHDSDVGMRNWLMNEYGAEKGMKLYKIADAHAWISVSWECKDCVALNEAGYFEKRAQTNHPETAGPMK